DEQASPQIAQLAERVQQRTQPLALESRAHEQNYPRFIGDTERGAGLAAIPCPMVRVKAVEIDTVVDQAHALGRRPVERLDLRLARRGAPADVPSGSQLEHSPLERADQPVVWIPAGPTSHGREVCLMAALTRAIDVLVEGSLVAMHDVVGARR